MEKVLIIGCKNTMNEICVGCSRCLVAFNRRAGEFSRYGKDDELMGILSCGGCPGQGIVMRMAQMNLWNAPLKERPTKVHIGPCLTDHCPHADDLVTKIQVKAGVEVIEGTHPYVPGLIFAPPAEGA